jgi:hypothetical protein
MPQSAESQQLHSGSLTSSAHGFMFRLRLQCERQVAARGAADARAFAVRLGTHAHVSCCFKLW